jgi:hypothetical protein
MPADPSSSPAPRASDADRDRVIELLHTAVADGRLDPAEFDERLGAIRESGLPYRIRPGFWDSNTPYSGTAGVLALACDRIIERGGDFDFANVLVDDLTAPATVDDAGVRWSNYEHRATPSDLEPRWAGDRKRRYHDNPYPPVARTCTDPDHHAQGPERVERRNTPWASRQCAVRAADPCPA